MPRTRRRSRFLPTLGLSLAFASACAEGDANPSTFSGGSGITTATATATMTATATAAATDTSGDGDSESDTDASTSGDPTASTSDASTSSTGPGSTSNPDGLPNGSECSSPAMCMSGNCYTIPLPINDLPSGICGVCDADQDCVDAGLGTACSIDVVGYASKCTDGSIGSFCQTQAACQDGLYCQELLDGVGNLLPLSCGQCRDDNDCTGSARCTPKIDVVAYTGNKYCAMPGTVANDGMCPIDNGDAICQSGHCEIVNVGGLIDAGVCGACSSDGDCGGGTCTPGKWADGFVGSTCT